MSQAARREILIRHAVCLGVGLAMFGVGYVLGAGLEFGALLGLGTWVVLVTCVPVLWFEGTTAYDAVRSRTAAEMVGLRGSVTRACDPRGQVRVRGELWRAESRSGPLEPGDEITVTAVDGLLLTVAPGGRVQQTAPPSPNSTTA